jgi:S1-C subfamily serine protease
MSGRFFRFVVIVALLLLVAYVAEPYITRLMFAQTTPRPIEARGNLSDAERSIISLFERVSPSVVQVVGRQAGGDLLNDEEEGLQSGTGFVWDGAGNIVTNYHVISGTNEVVVRLSSGSTTPREVHEYEESPSGKSHQ